jgi:hypothetical protein
MQKSKWAIEFKAVAFIFAFVAVGAFYIYRGATAGSLKELLLGVLLLLIGGRILWINVKITEYATMPFDEQINDLDYVELRSYFRETLLSLGFEEKQESGRFVISDYSLGELLVRFGKDPMENFYLFQASNKSKIFNFDGKSHSVPDFDLSVSGSHNNTESFKVEVREKLSEWLKEQKLK